MKEAIFLICFFGFFITMLSSVPGNGPVMVANSVPTSPIQISDDLSTVASPEEEPRIAVVKPIFTDTAYSHAFYTFYWKHGENPAPFITTDLNYLNVTVEDDWGWSTGLREFLSSYKASLAGIGLESDIVLIDEINVALGALFDEDRRNYDVVILGFTEYVTAEEYAAYRRFVETGGTLIIMDACNFLAEVKYYPPSSPGESGYLSLVKGHGWEFNGTHAWKSVYHRWPDENRNWVGSNYWRYWYGDHYDYLRVNTSHPISNYIRDSYGENITSRYGAHEENKLENLTDTQVIGYWHFIDPGEAPSEPIAAYQHFYGNGSVFHTGIMASDVVQREEFMQALLVCMIRMALTGEVGNWGFWEDSTFQSSSKLFFGNGTEAHENDLLSGLVECHVTLNTSLIAQDGHPYSLTGVEATIRREDSFISDRVYRVNGTKTDDAGLTWCISINTLIIPDAVYTIQVGCRFVSCWNATFYIDSTIMIATYEIQNLSPDLRLRMTLILALFTSIAVFGSVFVVWNGRRPEVSS
ncbi:MAG: hypothetical protein JSW05_02145 [Candidatus Thorarchaeota archaeon]|nr:MAG: hypothetical protein JSW05_02145 [Candidatus Thorarchaeota archaeon]